MALTNPRNKISARPQIKPAVIPTPRQVIVPQKTQPVAKAPVNTLVSPPPLVSPKPLVSPLTIQPPPLVSPVAKQLTSPTVGNTNPSDLQTMMDRLQKIQNQPQTVIQPQTSNIPDFNSYGFSQDMVNYLNNQRQMSAMDAGISYNYDPATQTFKGSTMGGPVTKTLAEMQAEAQNYNRTPAFNPQNTGGVAQTGFGQPQVPYQMNQPVGVNSVAPTLAQNTSNNQMYGQQLPLGGNPMFEFGQPNNQSQLFQQLGMQPQQGFGATPNVNYNQQGFAPLGGYNPQNTSVGSFGSVQQPAGGFGNINSLLG